LNQDLWDGENWQIVKWVNADIGIERLYDPNNEKTSNFNFKMPG
jgi:hypothetical protein